MPVKGDDEVGATRRVLQRDGRQHPEPDPPSWRSSAPCSGGFTSDVSHELRTPADHRADGRRRALRLAGPVCPPHCAVLRSCWSRSWTGSRRCSPTCWRSAAWTPAWPSWAPSAPTCSRSCSARWRRSAALAEESGTRLELDVRAGVYAEIDPAPGGADRAQPGGQRAGPRRGQAGADPARRRRGQRRRTGPRPRPRAAAGRGRAGVQPVLARRLLARPAQRRVPALGLSISLGGRPAARRLAAGLGRTRPGAPRSG